MAVGFPTREIARLHKVRWLVQTGDDFVILIECVGDRINYNTEAMILLDVLCTGSDEAQLLHSISIIRNQMAFQDFLSMLRLSRVHRLHPHVVSITVNGQRWDENSLVPLRFAHGDHITLYFAMPTREDYRRDLVDWLRDEGVTPDDHLLQPIVNSTISPTLPFTVDETEGDHNNEQPSCSNRAPALAAGEFLANSWYISHEYHTVCHDSRVLTVSADPATWDAAIRRTWGDYYDGNRPFTATLVFPGPPIGQLGYDHLPHIILEQHFRPQQISVLVTTQRVAQENEIVAQAAYSVKDYMAKTGYVQFVQAWRFGRSPQFDYRVWHGQREILDRNPFGLPTGQAVTVSGCASG